MSEAEVIGAVEQCTTCCSAVNAIFVQEHKPVLLTKPCNSEQAARPWIGSQAGKLGFEHSDVEYRNDI